MRRTTAVVVAGVAAVVGAALTPGTPLPRLIGGWAADRAGERDGLAFTVQSTTRARIEPAADGPRGVRDRGTTAGQLLIELKVQNRSPLTRVIWPGEFALNAVGGRTWSPRDHTFPLTTLGPRQYLHGVLTFEDVPESATDLQLVWTPPGTDHGTFRARDVRVAIDTRASSTARPTRWGMKCHSPSPWCP